MRPRWKIVTEFIVAIVLTLVGVYYMARSVEHQFAQFSDILWFIWGLLIVDANTDRIKNRWKEL